MLYCLKPGLLSWKSRIRLNICALRPALVTSNLISPLLVTFIDREGFMLWRTFKSEQFSSLRFSYNELSECVLCVSVTTSLHTSGLERTSVLVLSLRSYQLSRNVEKTEREREREREREVPQFYCLPSRPSPPQPGQFPRLQCNCNRGNK